MKLLQLYYTSCKQGRSSGPGFQVYSASEGLTPEEIIELERICMYVPPSHLPSQPTVEEMKNQFPVSFSSFQLKSGRYGVCQSVYIGKDYSERFGNYFSHAIILEEGKWPFAPILLYGSPHFRTSLTEAEMEIDQPPDNLPPIFMEKPNGSITLPSVQQFLNKKNRYFYLEQMLNGLLERGNRPGALVIAADHQDVPNWIAAVQLSFPVQLANELSFSTYVHDPDREDYTISATTAEGTRFDFQHAMRRSDMYAYNFINHLFSEVQENYRYVESVVTNQLSMERLKQFFNGFTLNEPTEELDQFLDLTTLCLDEQVHLDLDQLKGAIQFAINYSSKQNSTQLLNQLSSERLIERCPDMVTATLVSKFLIDSSKKTEDMHHQEMAAHFILEKMHDFVTDDLPLDDIQLFLNEQMKHMNSSHSIQRMFLKDEKLRILQRHLMEMHDIKKHSFYLQITVQMMLNEQLQWKELTNEQKAFLLFLCENNLVNQSDNVFEWSILTTDSDFFVDLFLELYQTSRAEKQQVIDLFSLLLDDKNHNHDWTTRCFNKLSETKMGRKLLNDQFERRILRSSSIDKMTELIEIATHFIPTHNMSQLILHYANSLLNSEETTMDTIANIVKKEKIRTLLEEHKILENILNQGQKHIEFSDAAIAQNLNDYEIFISYYEHLNSEPYVYQLVVITYKSKQKRRKNYEQLEQALVQYLSPGNKFLKEDMFQAYLIWSLPEVIDMIYGHKKQTSLLVKDFIQAYPTLVLEALSVQKQQAKIKYSPELLVDLFACFNQTRKKQASYQQLVDYFIQHEDDYKKVNELMKKQPKLQNNWKKMYEDVQNQKGSSFVRSFKKIFGSKR